MRGLVLRDGCRLHSWEIARIAEDYAGCKPQRTPRVRRISRYDVQTFDALYAEGYVERPILVHDDM